MGNLETIENENRNELILEAQAEVYLREIRKWAKFLAIVGFIIMGLMAIMSIGMFAFSNVMGDAMPFPMAGAGVFYLLFIALYCVPIYYLLQFSNKAKYALESRNTQTLTEAMLNLKSHYKFMGIFTIVILSLYPIIIIGAIIFGASQGF